MAIAARLSALAAVLARGGRAFVGVGGAVVTLQAQGALAHEALHAVGVGSEASHAVAVDAARLGSLHLARVVVDCAVVFAGLAVVAVPALPCARILRAKAPVRIRRHRSVRGRVRALPLVLAWVGGAGRRTRRSTGGFCSRCDSRCLAREALRAVRVRRTLAETSRTRKEASAVHACRARTRELTRIIVDRAVVLARLTVQAVPMECAETRVRPIDQRRVGRAGGRVRALTAILARHRGTSRQTGRWSSWLCSRRHSRSLARVALKAVRVRRRLLP